MLHSYMHTSPTNNMKKDGAFSERYLDGDFILTLKSALIR